MRIRLRWRMSLLIGVLMLVVAGCTGEQTKPAELSDLSESATTASSESPSASPDEQAIEEAYLGYFNTMATLGQADADTIRSTLAPYAVGFAVDRVVEVIATLQAKNQAPGGFITFGKLEVSISGDAATVRECRDGSTQTIVDSTSGTVLSTGSADTGFETQLQRQADGAWKVQLYDLSEGIC